MRRAIRSPRDLAAVVRGRRKDLGLSQAELARQVGAARKTVSELESGRSVPEFGLVLRVLEQLGLAVGVDSAASVKAEAPKRTVDLDAVIEEHRAK